MIFVWTLVLSHRVCGVTYGELSGIRTHLDLTGVGETPAGGGGGGHLGLNGYTLPNRHVERKR